MEGTVFSVRFKALDKLRRSGADEAEFLLSTGKRSGRVEKIASGGELSRLLLALQLSLPDPVEADDADEHVTGVGDRGVGKHVDI